MLNEKQNITSASKYKKDFLTKAYYPIFTIRKKKNNS